MWMKGNYILRFSTVGVLNTLVDITVFAGIMSLTSWPAYAAQCVGYAAGMLSSFTLNKTWTFRGLDAGSSLAGEVFRFFTVNVFSMAVSSGTMWLFADIMGISALVSKAAVLALTLVINYAGYRFWVFNG